MQECGLSTSTMYITSTIASSVETNVDVQESSENVRKHHRIHYNVREGYCILKSLGEGGKYFIKLEIYPTKDIAVSNGGERLRKGRIS